MGTKTKVIIIFGVALGFLSLGIYTFKVNNLAKSMEKYTEITFVNPNQAVIFWKSREASLGYIKYGDKKYDRKNIELQTSSEPGEIHVVFLDRIPEQGFYISKHIEDSNILVFPMIEHIEYSETEEIENE
ncbi:MAG: hypothetical protein U9Q67_00330 [Patescibacteria group bacterium]|nr:hypothetical protein [Patescibacteria group bacterium]